MSAPVGRVVGLYLDVQRDVREGDVIETQTGRSYRVVDVRRQERGIHAGRWHLHAVVVDPATVTAEDDVIRIVWYRR